MIPLLLNSFVPFGLQMRAVWLGFSLSLLLWGLLAGPLTHLAKIVGMLACLLLIGWIVDFQLPGPATRGGEISTRSLVGRAIAPFSREDAGKFTAHADSFADTVDWRRDWWAEIWSMTHRTAEAALIGPGYGYPLWELNPWGIDKAMRTPHNIFLYALGYTGWIGVGVFALLLLALGRLLWCAYSITGQPFGLCFWLQIVVWAAFDGLLEAPYGGIPFYVICGLAVAPLVAGANSRRTVSVKPGVAI